MANQSGRREVLKSLVPGLPLFCSVIPPVVHEIQPTSKPTSSIESARPKLGTSYIIRLSYGPLHPTACEVFPYVLSESTLLSCSARG